MRRHVLSTIVLIASTPLCGAGFNALSLPGSQLSMLSADGQTAAGGLVGGASGGFRWHDGEAPRLLPGAMSVRAMSASGRYVAGSSLDAGEREVATWWAADGPAHPLGGLPGADARAGVLSVAYGVTDQPHVVGTAFNAQRASVAFAAPKNFADPTTARAALHVILDTPADVRANFEVLCYAGAPLVDKASTDEKGFDALGAQLIASLEKSDAGQSADSQLDIVNTEIALYRVHHPDGALPAALIQKVKTKVAAADVAAKTPYERQATISSAADLLNQAGDAAGAEKLLIAELGKSQTPYYYMPELAELAEKRGDKATALEWLKRGYAKSEGPATRVQWGELYVNGLVRLTPTDGPTIERIAGQVIDELGNDGAGYYQRTQQRLERMEIALSKWSAGHDGAATLERLKGRLAARCGNASQADGHNAACGNWMSN